MHLLFKLQLSHNYILNNFNKVKKMKDENAIVINTRIIMLCFSDKI